MIRRTALPAAPVVRCAIYTRKSTEEGLDQDFNSLDAQRESAEAFIKSQVHEGWVCLPTRYDDGGYTGGNMDRPALQRLLRDIEAGQVDSVVVYKVDRLSRSLLDFSKMIDVFDRHKTTFVSVTQQLNTTTSMGRLTLNVLLSFAQFEREIISERTRDKMAAARRKGKYVGGAPVLGYDIDRDASCLRVNEREAIRVRQIFDAYLKHGSLIPTITELDRRGWTTKGWITKAGKDRGARKFNKNNLYGLLTNLVYLGKICYRDEVYDGEHPAIVDPEVFERVRKQLDENRRTGGSAVRNVCGALLRGLLRCAPCGCAMTHSHSTRGNKRYRYYVCLQAQKRGHHTCPSKSLPAAEIERHVIDQVRAVCRDPRLIEETIRQARQGIATSLAALEEERRLIEHDMAAHHSEMRRLAISTADPADLRRLADLQDQIRRAEQRLTAIREETIELQRTQVGEDEVTASLQEFEPLWETLSPRERARVLQLVVDHVDYDGAAGTVAITFRPIGLKALGQETQK